MDVNSLLSNELGVVALPYSIVSSNGASTPQDAATLVSMPTVLSPEDAQWIPDSNGSVLLTFSAINGIPLEKQQELVGIRNLEERNGDSQKEADGSTTFLPFVPSLYLTENGTLVSGPLEGSPQTVTLLEPSTADSPQTVIEAEPSPLTGDQIITSVLDSGSENSPLPAIDLGNLEFCTNEKGEQLFDDSFNDIVAVVTLYKCKLCEFKCEDKAELAKHLDVHKNKSVSTNPKRKNKQTKFNEKTVLQKKRNIGIPSRVAEGEDCNTHMFFSCGACLTVCTSMDELREHMKKIHGIMKEDDEEEEAGVDCGEPPEIDLSVSEVIESIAEVENESEELRVETVATPLGDGLRDFKFQCTMCKLRFSTRVNMERHRKCHNPDYNGPGVSKFKCLVCSQGYTRWTFCQAHLWLVHKIDMDLHTCLICDYKTVHRDKYLSHQKRHQELKEFACRYCAKQFSQKTQLRNHEVLHMKKNADAKLPEWAKPKECDHCHKTFCDSKALKKHVKTVHSKLKPYVCQVCGHCSARKGMFQLHIRQHTGDKPFSCSACDFTTRDHNSLRRHTMRHTGVRQYQCKFCSYSAIQAQLFKQHLIKNHGGDGVFLCNICSFSTLNEQAFIYHHHDDEPKPDKDSEDKPTVIYVPFSEKDKSNKKGSGELIAINLPDDEESNNFFDHEAAIDTGGITIVEDVGEGKKPGLSSQQENESLMDMTVTEDVMGTKEVPSTENDIARSKWGISENVDDSTMF